MVVRAHERQHERSSIPLRIKLESLKILGWEATAHTLRHSFATQDYADSGDINRTSKLLGQSSPAITARVYEYSDPDSAFLSLDN